MGLCHSSFSFSYSIAPADIHILSLTLRQTLNLNIAFVSEWWACDSWLCLSCHVPLSCVFACPCHPGCRSLSSVASLESPVICCLGPLIQYLQEFNLERVLRIERYVHQRKYTHSTIQAASIIVPFSCRNNDSMNGSNFLNQTSLFCFATLLVLG